MANSSQFVIPSISAPALKRRCTAVAVYGGLKPLRICDPAVVSTPRTHSTSLIAIGMPTSGPRSPRTIRLSASSACFSQSSGVKRRKAFTLRSSLSMRSTCAVTSSEAEKERSRSSLAASLIVSSVRSVKPLPGSMARGRIRRLQPGRWPEPRPGSDLAWERPPAACWPPRPPAPSAGSSRCRAAGAGRCERGCRSTARRKTLRRLGRRASFLSGLHPAEFSRWSPGHEGEELLLVQDCDLELLRLLQLRTGARPGDHIVGLRAHARDRLTAQPANQRLRVGPAHRLHRPGEYKRLACQRTLARRLDRLRLHPTSEELGHQLAAMTLEIHVHLACHVRTHALDFHEVFLGRAPQPLDAPEIGGEQIRRCLTDLRDAQRVEESAELRPAAVTDPVEQVLRRLVGKASELHNLLLGQAVQVARVLNPAAVDDLTHGGVTETIDVQGAAAGEVAQTLQALCGAERVDAPMSDIGLLAHHFPATHRTSGGHLPAGFRLLDAHDLGDDVASPMDDDPGADVHTLVVYLRLFGPGVLQYR